MKKTIVTYSCTLLCSLSALADTTVYSIQDISLNPGFTGTGFLSINPYTHSINQEFGLEYYTPTGVYSETEMEVDISGLTGTTISSAVLSYNLLNGDPGEIQTVTATSFLAQGQLSFNT